MGERERGGGGYGGIFRSFHCVFYLFFNPTFTQAAESSAGERYSPYPAPGTPGAAAGQAGGAQATPAAGGQAAGQASAPATPQKAAPGKYVHKHIACFPITKGPQVAPTLF